MKNYNLLFSLSLLLILGTACEPEPPKIGPDIYVDIDCAKYIPKQGYDHQIYWQGSYYLLSNRSRDVYQARHAAAAMSGHLVTIQSQAENDIVQSLLDEAGVHTALIGLADFETENFHSWLNAEPLQYTNWQRGEPNNTAFGNCTPNRTPACEEDAVTIAGKSHAEAGGWNDVPDYFTYFYVVEIDCERSRLQ